MKIYDYQGKKNVSGDMIRQLRVKNRMSQNDLAARVQVEGVMLERDSISRIESGTRFVADYELFVFAKVLGVVCILAGISGEEVETAGNGSFSVFKDVYDTITLIKLLVLYQMRKKDIQKHILEDYNDRNRKETEAPCSKTVEFGVYLAENKEADAKSRCTSSGKAGTSGNERRRLPGSIYL